MKTKKSPMRKCIGCQISKEKKQLLRVVRTPDGKMCVDVTGKMNGRGAYICPDESCLKAALKAKRLESALATQIDNEVIETLISEIKEVSEQ
ncbi:MAG: YlxR family protein [Ruminococcaceae bacterium]|nr:YlxR family protein [Oscillospiraceae bacterium]